MKTKTPPKEDGLERRDGILHFDGADLEAVATRVGTPCYVYSRSLIERAWQRYSDALGDAGQVCYAVKANPARAILHCLARLGAGFDIVSTGEMQRVLAAGGQPGSIVFVGVGKRDDEILAALDAGVGTFNVESQPELERLSQLASDKGVIATAVLRVNPDVTADTHRHIATGGGHHKFGIAQRDVPALARAAARLPAVKLDGLAMHIGSQIEELDSLIEAATRLVSLADELSDAGIVIEHLDLGGGLGVGPNAPAIEDYVAALKKTAGAGYRLTVEPGRSLVAEAGLMLTSVVRIKGGHQRDFAIVDAGMNDFLRPALYDAWHDIVSVVERERLPVRRYDVVGPVCETADTLGNDRELAVRERSLLAVLHAGAYGATMGSHYNSRPRCAEVMISNGVAHVIRAPETVADLMRLETVPEP